MSEKEKQFRDAHSFKPEVHDFEEKEDLTKEERWRRLLEPKTEEIQKREQTKIIQENEKIKKECSFKPKIGEGSAQIA